MVKVTDRKHRSGHTVSVTNHNQCNKDTGEPRPRYQGAYHHEVGDSRNYSYRRRTSKSSSSSRTATRADYAEHQAVTPERSFEINGPHNITIIKPENLGGEVDKQPLKSYGRPTKDDSEPTHEQAPSSHMSPVHSASLPTDGLSAANENYIGSALPTIAEVEIPEVAVTEARSLLDCLNLEVSIADGSDMGCESSQAADTSHTSPDSSHSDGQESYTCYSPMTNSQASQSAGEDSSGSSTGDENGTTILLGSRREIVIERTMAWFTSWLDDRLAAMIVQYQGGSDGGLPEITPTEHEVRGRSQGTKRNISRRNPGHDQDEDESLDEDESGGCRRGKRLKQVEADASREKFACPFYQHDRRFFRDWRVCKGPGWDDVHRVKYVLS